MYFFNKTFNICIKFTEPDDVYKLMVCFPGKSTVVDTEDIQEVFDNVFKSGNIFLDSYSNIFVYTLADKDSQPLLIFVNNESNCKLMQKHFKKGVIEKSNISVSKSKGTVKKEALNFKTMKNRFSQIPTFESSFLSKAVDGLSFTLPEKYKVIHVTQTDTFKDVCNDSTYLTDSKYVGIFETLSSLPKMIEEIKVDKAVLKKAIEIADLETLNILHELELEFDKVNACQGYKLSEKLHNVRRVRRNAKDKLEIIAQLETLLNISNLEALINVPAKLENREYRKRGTFGVFDDGKLDLALENN